MRHHRTRWPLAREVGHSGTSTNLGRSLFSASLDNAYSEGVYEDEGG